MDKLENALKLHKENKLNEAEELYTEVLNEEPENSSALNLYGVLLLQSGRAAEAELYLLKAVDINPCAAICENLALAYFCRQNFIDALKYYEKALESEPTFETVEQIIKCYEGLKLFDTAIEYCKILYENKPDDIDIIRKMAYLYNKNGNYTESFEMYKKSLSKEPRDYIGLNNAGLVCEKLNDLVEARRYYEKSLKIRENYEALHNLGVLARKERQADESIKLLHRALKLQPDNIQTKTSLGMAYFTKKDFYNGQKYYKYRNPVLSEQSKNNWDGAKHTDKTLLIYFDGGHGDQLMFCRYIKYLKGYFKEIKMYVYPSLTELFKRNFPDISIHLVTDNVDYDYSVNIMELHWALDMDFNNIPSEKSYLSAESEKTSYFKEKYFNNKNKKIGLFWQGNPKVFKNRAIKLKELEPIFNMPDTSFYSFQKNDIEKQIASYPQIMDLEDELIDFDDTASALKNLDLLITIDTAIAHLSGALGIKTILLLPYASEWRWFDETQKTQWYPSVTIYKQSEEGNWTPVIQELKKDLQASV